jgi:UbiA prenyltransferase family
MAGSLRLLCLRRRLSVHSRFTAADDTRAFSRPSLSAQAAVTLANQYGSSSHMAAAAVVCRKIRWLSVNSNPGGDTSRGATITSSTKLSEDDDAERTLNNTALSVSHPANHVPVQKSSSSKAYRDLAKARLSALVVATTAAGFLAAGGPISTQLDVLAACIVGTTLCSSSAAAWNQIFEVNRDAKMKRTQQRPLVNGSLTMPQATTAATVWGMAGTSLLALGTDPVTTALGAGNIILYGGIYTHMKPVSIYNTWVGAVVGAIPPVMGWTAATGGSIMDVEALLLGSL